MNILKKLALFLVLAMVTVAPLQATTTYFVPDSRTVNGHALTANVTVTKADISLGNVENTALSTWAGSTNLLTLGLVGTGTWQATPIDDLYITSASTWNNKISVGGQLGGTPFSPTVTGITETSGPTALTVGTVADGQFVQRQGTNLAGVSNTLVPAPQPGHMVRLRSTNSGTTLVYILADSITVWAGGTNYQLLIDVNLTINLLSTVGANGRDAGTFNASDTGMWFIYIIAKPDGTTAGLGSKSATNPVMPTGYTYKKLIKNEIAYASGGAAKLYKNNQQGRNIFVSPTIIPIFSATSASWTAKDISLYVPINDSGGAIDPPIAIKIWGQIRIAVNRRIQCALSWNNDGTGNTKIFNIFPSALFEGSYTSQDFDYLLNPDDSGTIYVEGDSALNTGDFYLYGYELEI